MNEHSKEQINLPFIQSKHLRLKALCTKVKQATQNGAESF